MVLFSRPTDNGKDSHYIGCIIANPLPVVPQMSVDFGEGDDDMNVDVQRCSYDDVVMTVDDAETRRNGELSSASTTRESIFVLSLPTM